MPAPIVAPSQPRLSPWGFDVGVGLAADLFGSEVTASAGASVHARLRWRWLSVAAEASGYLPSTSADLERGGSLRVQAWRAIGVACGHPSRWSLCATAGGGATAVVVEGGVADASPTVAQLWLGIRVGFDLARVGRLRLSTRVDALWTPTPLEVTTGASTWTQQWLLSLGIGASWSIL